MEKYKDLLPSSDIESSRDHYGLYHSRDFYKGKSLNFANQWAKGTHYFDDEYITDFVAYKGTLLACKRSHLSSEDNEPKLIYDSVNDIQQAIGVDSPFGILYLQELLVQLETKESKVRCTFRSTASLLEI